MNLYKRLEISNLSSMQEKLFNLVPKHLFAHPRLFFPEDQTIFQTVFELTDFLYSLNLDPANTRFAFYVVMPKTTGAVHKDYGDADYSINIPIKNCAGTILNFYTTSAEPVLQDARIENGFEFKPHYYYNPSDCECVETIDCGTPYIMNIKNIHNVQNPTYNPRINLLCRPNDNQAMSNILNGSE